MMSTPLTKIFGRAKIVGKDKSRVVSLLQKSRKCFHMCKKCEEEMMEKKT